MLYLDDVWVWDSWPVTDGDTYHLFFLYAPRSLGDPDLRHVSARIGHVTSTDLRAWTRLPDPVSPGPAGSFDEVACWTGSTVRGPGGRWYLHYTGLTHTDVAAGLHRQRVGLAVSDDLVTWTKVDASTIDADPRWYEVAGEPPAYQEAWRDPWVFPDPRGDGWHLLATATAAASTTAGVGDDDRGVLGHAWSADLTGWEVRAPLSSPGAGFSQLEVPQLVEVDGRTHLVFSCLAPELAGWRRGPGVTGGHWVVPDVDPLGPYDVATAVPLTDDTLYAGRVLIDPQQQPVLLAFVNRHAGGPFAGVISDPLPVELGPHGPARVISAPH